MSWRWLPALAVIVGGALALEQAGGEPREGTNSGAGTIASAALFAFEG